MPQKPWYDEGLRFECTRCGDCCLGHGFVWVDLEEMQALADFLGLPFEEFTTRYVRQAGERYSLIDRENQACVFWRNGCTVYAARPGQCRTFPFWEENLAEPEDWAMASRKCAGINKGSLHSRETIVQFLTGKGSTSGEQAPTSPLVKGGLRGVSKLSSR